MAAMNDTVLYLHGPMVRSARLLLDSFMSAAAAHGWNVRDVVPPPEMDRAALDRLVAFWRPVGVVVDCGQNCLREPPKELAGVPLVCIDADVDPEASPGPGRAVRTGYVLTDARALAHLAAETLLRRNLASYACVTANAHLSWSESRRRFFREAIRLNGGVYREFDGQGLAAGDAARLREFSAWLRNLPRPCGLFVVHDRMAQTVLAALAHCGLAVPDDVAVLGVDDDEALCEGLAPPLSSIRIDFVEGGRRAAGLLADLVVRKFRAAPVVCYGSGRLVPRLSTRALAQPSPSVRAALEVIRRRAAEGLTATDVLPMLGGSRRMAERRFRAATGHGILQEIQEVRFERLLSLLADPSVPLASLPGRAGFTSENNLQRQFKARFGTTLSAYRRAGGATACR